MIFFPTNNHSLEIFNSEKYFFFREKFRFILKLLCPFFMNNNKPIIIGKNNNSLQLIFFSYKTLSQKKKRILFIDQFNTFIISI